MHSPIVAAGPGQPLWLGIRGVDSESMTSRSAQRVAAVAMLSRAGEPTAAGEARGSSRW